MSEVLRPNLKKPLIVWAQLSGLYVSNENDTGLAGNPARTFFEYWLAVPANRWAHVAVYRKGPQHIRRRPCITLFGFAEVRRWQPRLLGYHVNMEMCRHRAHRGRRRVFMFTSTK